jgi:long-chain acyl-CoA synthetase
MLYSEPLPRTPLGKLRRFKLRDMVDGVAVKKQQRAVDKALLGDEIGYKVVECINAVMQDKIPVQADDNLELDLGFDSLKRIEFISSLEEVFSVRLPETFVSDVQTVGDVVSLLKQYAEGRGEVHLTPVTWQDILEKEPPEEDRRKAGFRHGPTETVAIYLMVMSLKLFLRLYCRMSVKGKDNIPGSGPYMLAANHASYLDGFVVAAAIPVSTFANIRFLGISKFFSGSIKGTLGRMSHVIPIDAETYLNRALQMSSYVLSQGKSLCIFPEGGRAFGAGALPFKKGVGIIAVERKIPVVPVYIGGSSQALPRGAVFIRPARIRVIFGKPFSINNIDMKSKPAAVDEYQFFADQLRQRVLSLEEIDKTP